MQDTCTSSIASFKNFLENKSGPKEVLVPPPPKSLSKIEKENLKVP
jgi:hypothetical protein